MPRLPTLLFAFVLATLVPAAFAQPAVGPAERPELLLRLDDVGMNHAVNEAIRAVAEADLPFSASVMVPTPWFDEAVALLKEHPQVSAGIHLTLNAEWRGYRWGPVLGREAVPSLVDSTGRFHASTAAFLASDYDLAEVERELTAQVRQALDAGLALDYVDYHMGTAVATPELRAVVERVADRFELGISQYFGEDYSTLFAEPIEGKEEALLTRTERLVPDAPNLVVVHVARAHPAMQALVDLNNPDQNTTTGEPLVSQHRQAELEALLSDAFRQRVERGTFTLVTYADVVAQGLDAMRAPQ